MTKTTNNSITFLKPPQEYPVPGEHFVFETKEIDLKELGENEIITRNLFLSLDTFVRGRMKGAAVGPFGYTVGQTMTGFGVGKVLASNNPNFPVGSIVVGMLGWEEYSRLPAYMPPSKIIEGGLQSKIPASYYIGILGMPGLAAYASLMEIGKPKAGETIFVSAAAGGVGQLVGQIAKLKGLRVIGSAGSDEKVAYLLNELKFDAAFNYKKGNILESLRAAAGPTGIDIYYENVGGETLEAALEVLNNHGRILACGMISGYNTATPYGIKNTFLIVTKRIKMEGFDARDFFLKEVNQRFEKDVSQWLLNGDVVCQEDVTVGLENTLEAFVATLKGKNFGKSLIKLRED